MPEYNVLIDDLRQCCGNRSELNVAGKLPKNPDWQTHWVVEPHHIRGRIGRRFLDPFNIIMLTRNEHTIENDHKQGCHTPEELECLVRDIRISQGYQEEGLNEQRD